jgi:hypothetical protein
MAKWSAYVPLRDEFKGRPAERVLRDDRDPCTFYCSTTIEFTYSD